MIGGGGHPEAEGTVLQEHNSNGLELPRAGLTLLLSLWLALVLAAAIARPAEANSTPQPVTVPATPMQLGANTGVLFNLHRYSRAQIDDQLAALAHTGAKTVRSDALWETAEPSAPVLGVIHQYNWSQDDLVAGALAEHGLRWLPIIDYTANWDESIPGDDHSAPASVSDYYSYAAAVAARYGPGGTFWHDNPNLPQLPVDTYEVWNEPDSHYFWHPTPDPTAYAKLYTSARAAILTVQPPAHVLIGGLTNASSFLSSLLRVDPGIQGQIDGVAIHPYGPTPAHVLDNVRTARLAMRADGLGSVPLFVTEFGWTTQPSNAPFWASSQSRPGYIQQTLAGLGRTDCGIAGVFAYAWTTPERDPANPEDWYGISPPGAPSSPDVSAFAEGLLEASSAGPPHPLCSGPSPLAALHKTHKPKLRPRKRHRPRHHRPKHHPGTSARR